jgi:AcrR family transcriptional regulator
MHIQPVSDHTDGMATGQAAKREPHATRSALVAQRADATRAALIEAARRLFVERGCFETGTEEIVRAASVTRGALYHHFVDKKALFLAVFEAVEEDLAGAAGVIKAKDAFGRLEQGLLGFLQASLLPEVQQVLLIDGPAVLGWQEWRELEARYGLGAIAELLRAAMAEGTVSLQPVEPLAHLLLAALDEAALYIANAPDPPAAQKVAVAAMRSLLRGLERPAKPARRAAGAGARPAHKP